jgi:hypothetical protein
MQRFSNYQESSTNISNINGNIKQTDMDYYKENDKLGQGEIRLRDNNLQEKILFNENNMNNVVDYLKNRKKKQTSLKDRLNSFLTRKIKKRRKPVGKKRKGTEKANRKKKKRTTEKKKKRKGTEKVKKKKKRDTEKKRKRKKIKFES